MFALLYYVSTILMSLNKSITVLDLDCICYVLNYIPGVMT